MESPLTQLNKLLNLCETGVGCTFKVRTPSPVIPERSHSPLIHEIVLSSEVQLSQTQPICSQNVITKL